MARRGTGARISPKAGSTKGAQHEVHCGCGASAMIAGPIGVGVVGYGYWGPNVVRNIVECPELRLVGLCEFDRARGEEFSRRHPGIGVEREFEALLEDPGVHAVAIA